MDLWEYVDMLDNECDPNTMGEKGWEAYALKEYDHVTRYYYKRKLPIIKDQPLRGQFDGHRE
jgi:hypothetical protein